MNEFVNLISSCRKNIRIINLTHQDMFTFDNKCMRRQANFKISKLRCMKFQKESFNLEYKYELTEDTFKTIDLMKRGATKKLTLDVMGEARGVTTKKASDLIWCSNHLPHHQRKFFTNIPVNDHEYFIYIIT